MPDPEETLRTHPTLVTQWVCPYCDEGNEQEGDECGCEVTCESCGEEVHLHY